MPRGRKVIFSLLGLMGVGLAFLAVVTERMRAGPYGYDSQGTPKVSAPMFRGNAELAEC